MASQTRREAIRKDLDDYISARKRRKFSFKSLFSLSSEVKPYKEEKQAIVEQAAVVEEHSPAAQKLEKEYEEEETTWFAMILEKIGITNKPEDAIEEPIAEPVNEEMKEIGRISLKILKRLPDSDLSAFKNSSDFEKFKEILRNNKLIK